MNQNSEQKPVQRVIGSTSLPTGDANQAIKPQVDLNELAKEVIRLLKKDLRIEKERMGRRPG